jgi:hypothetical protein
LQVRLQQQALHLAALGLLLALDSVPVPMSTHSIDV